MRLDMNMTDKDKKILIALITVVIIVGFGFLGIRPLISHYNSRKVELQTEEDRKQINEKKVSLYSDLEQYTTDLKQKVTNVTANYYPILKSDEIDRMLTNQVVGMGLKVNSLNITMPTEELTLVPYGTDANAQTADTASGDTVMTSVTQDAYGFDPSLASGEAASSDSSEASTDSTEATADTTNEATGTGLYAAEVVLKVQGDGATMKQLIEEFAANYPSIRITGYSWDSESNVTATAADAISIENYDILELDLEVYMCTKEGE